jgi:pyruvate formate lyase activating enzyme
LAPGAKGRCRVRINREGEMYTLTYGQIMAASPDPVEKKPLFHFKPGHRSFSIALAGCNFNCDFCQNWRISQANQELLAQSAALEPTDPGQVIQQALHLKCQSISYTYTEPIVFWEYALECMKLAKGEGLSNIVVSNGFGSAAAWQASQGLLDAANIDLKAFSDEFYKKICGGRLEKVLDSLRQLHALGVWLEITTLRIPGENDQLEALAEFMVNSLSPDVPWHISAYHPAYRRRSQATAISQLQQARQAGLKAGLNYVYIGNAPVESGADTACPQCGRRLIERRGYRVTNNNLIEGACPHCHRRIAGIWQ